MVPPVVVLSAQREDGLVWRVLVEAAVDGLLTMVERSRGGVSQTSGFGGPPPSDSQKVDLWTGRSDGLPPFLLVRTTADVSRLSLRSGNGDVAVALSETSTEFGLRFGAQPVDNLDDILFLSVHLKNGKYFNQPLH